MKAAHGSPSSTVNGQHGCDKYSSSEGLGLTIKSHSPSPYKMGMPSLLRLDSTGEVAPADGPSHSTGHQSRRVDNGSRHQLDQGSSFSGANGLLGKFMDSLSFIPRQTYTNHLMRSQTRKQSTCGPDELAVTMETSNHSVKEEVRSPLKMGHFHQANRYEQWAISGPSTFCLPPGIFPCHLFRAYQNSNSRCSPQQFPSYSAKSLVDACEQFAAQKYPSLNSHCAKPVLPSHIICDPTNNSLKCDSKSEVENIQALNAFRESPQFSLQQRNSDTHLNLKHTHSSQCSHLDGSIKDRPNENRIECKTAADLKPCQKVPKNYIINESVQDGDHLTKEISCKIIPTNSELDNGGKRSAFTELPVSVCQESFNSAVKSDMLKHVINDATSQENKCENIVGTSCMSMHQKNENLLQDQDDSDWSEEGEEEVDEESQAEALRCFLFNDFSVSACWSNHYNDDDERSPPRPNHAANKRWNEHYSFTVTAVHPRKVQFSCGKEFDEVHLVECNDLTVMERQKQHDVFKKNHGKAGELLQHKIFDEDSEDAENSVSWEVPDAELEGKSDTCAGFKEQKHAFRSENIYNDVINVKVRKCSVESESITSSKTETENNGTKLELKQSEDDVDSVQFETSGLDAVQSEEEDNGDYEYEYVIFSESEKEDEDVDSSAEEEDDCGFEH